MTEDVEDEHGPVISNQCVSNQCQCPPDRFCRFLLLITGLLITDYFAVISRRLLFVLWPKRLNKCDLDRQGFLDIS